MRYIFLLSAILLFAAPAFAAFPMHAAGNSETIAQHDIVHNSVAHVERMMPGHRAAGHGFAIGSLICGIVGLFTQPLIFGILAVVLGVLSMRKHPFRRPFGLVGFILGVIDIIIALH